MSIPAEAAQLESYRARWHATRLATGPVDRAAAEHAVETAYVQAGLEPPARVVWSDGPVAAARDWAVHQRGPSVGANVRAAILDRVQVQAVANVRASTSRDIWHRALSSVRSSVADGVSAEALRIVTRNAVAARGSSAPTISQLLAILFSVRHRTGRSATAPAFGRSSFGPYELGWLGAYQYLHDVAGLRSQTEVLGGLWALAQHAGWVVPHEGVCWLSERPSTLAFEAGGRLHSATGPALAYPDGWKVYCWKGIEVPPELIEERDRITLDQIDDTRDILIRRCMIEIMTPKRFIAMGGANQISRDETGVLWRRSWWNGDAWSAVEVVNGTPEPDGRRQTYVLQVPAEMRSARAAVAWTYGVSEHEYSKLTLRT